MQRFGEKLQALRQERGLTIRELAKELGYSAHGHLTSVETGKREPSLDIIRRVARYFGVSYDWLLAEDDAASDAAG